MQLGKDKKNEKTKPDKAAARAERAAAMAAAKAEKAATAEADKALKKGSFFRKRKFWTQFVWLCVMAAGCAFSIAERSIIVFTLSVVSTFLALNVFGRWPFKTNLVICSAVIVGGTLVGVFSWLEIISVFITMCVVGGFLLYLRDSFRTMLPILDLFGAELSFCRSVSEVAKRATDMISEMVPDCKVFVAVTDGIGGLYIPELRGEGSKEILSRHGGIVWKCFASGLPYRRMSVVPSEDVPLYRNAHSIIAAPMMTCGDCYGVIEVESAKASAFSLDDRDRLCLLAYITAQSVSTFVREQLAHKEEEIRKSDEDFDLRETLKEILAENRCDISRLPVFGEESSDGIAIDEDNEIDEPFESEAEEELEKLGAEDLDVSEENRMTAIEGESLFTEEDLMFDRPEADEAGQTKGVTD